MRKKIRLFVLKKRLQFKLFRFDCYHKIAVFLRNAADWLDPDSRMEHRVYHERYRFYGDRGSWR